MFNVYTLHFSQACSIDLENEVVITGAGAESNKVDMYNFGGWMSELPSLITGRVNHGCGHYINTDNKKVTKGYRQKSQKFKTNH